MEVRRESVKRLVDEEIKKSGPDITHLLAIVGNGDMQSGACFMKQIFVEEGIVFERLKRYVEDESMSECINDNSLEHECPQCGKVARNIDELTTLFGYQGNEEIELVPEIFCKGCRRYNQ